MLFRLGGFLTVPDRPRADRGDEEVGEVEESNK